MATASYNITSDRLFWQPDGRLSADDYDKAKTARFQWWPGRKLFSAVWNTEAEDLILAAGCEIAEDDTPDDLEGRIDRFQGYADNASRDAQAAEDALTSIDPTASYKHAPSAKRIAQTAARAVRATEEATYWQRRIAGAISNAQHKDQPGTIARRIKVLEAELRKQIKERDEHGKWLHIWRALLPDDPQAFDKVCATANYDNSGTRCYMKSEYPNSAYEGPRGLWSVLTDHVITPAQAQIIAIEDHERAIERKQRWIDHITMRLEYERAYLVAAGGLPADSMVFEVGGLAGGSYGWGLILKVNKTTIEIKQRWYHGKIDKTTIKAAKTAAEVKAMTPSELAGLLQ